MPALLTRTSESAREKRSCYLYQVCDGMTAYLYGRKPLRRLERSAGDTLDISWTLYDRKRRTLVEVSALDMSPGTAIALA